MSLTHWMSSTEWLCLDNLPRINHLKVEWSRVIYGLNNQSAHVNALYYAVYMIFLSICINFLA